ncbi:hypothetical protein D6827_01720 [Candidatus Parcubacteria bacterium]|nr:MAG: hypothetical protein D6827_01720 [Candidatus Parcubacteria bacterium]
MPFDVKKAILDISTTAEEKAAALENYFPENEWAKRELNLLRDQETQIEKLYRFIKTVEENLADVYDLIGDFAERADESAINDSERTLIVQNHIALNNMWREIENAIANARATVEDMRIEK